MSVARPHQAWKRRAFKRVVERDGALCALCSMPERKVWRKGGICSSRWPEHGSHHIVHCTSNLELDHRTPLRDGGDNGDGNLWLLCIDCHRKKTTAEHSSRLKKMFAEARV
jgi:5-methylcytosine-specific restriction endonuclease McrA